MAKKFISLTLLQFYDVKIKNFINSLITAANGDITALQAAIDLLNGDAEGSVNAKITAAFNDFSTKVTDDAVVNSYKELIDWVASHGSEAAEMAAAITALQGAVGKPANGEEAATGLYKAIADAQAAAEDATTKVNGLKNTAVSSTSGTDIKVDLGGTVGAPTVTVTYEFAEESDIESMFAPKGE